MRISGSSVLLTGASGGIGQATARALSGMGARLILTGRRLDLLEELADELGARAITADLSRPDEFDRLVDEAGEVDILIANAALPACGRLESFTAEQFDHILDLDLRAPIALTHALLPAMVERKRGHLVFNCSLGAKLATTHNSLYCAAKFGLRGFAQAMRAELHGTGVGVSAVFPGPVRDAGMLAESGVKLPSGVSTSSPQDVARALVTSIERNRGETDVMPRSARVATFLLRLHPDMAASLLRRTGGEELAEAYAQAVIDKR